MRTCEVLKMEGVWIISRYDRIVHRVINFDNGSKYGYVTNSGFRQLLHGHMKGFMNSYRTYIMGRACGLDYLNRDA